MPGDRARERGQVVKNTGERIRVFIGSEAKTEIARKVLQLSIERRTEMKVEFTPMIGPGWEYSLRDITVGTGFSLRRWMIPAACGWEGRAIYLDADQLVFGDIWDLWTMPEQSGAPRDTVCWTTYQPCKFWPDVNVPNTSVMVIDCAMAKKHWQWQIRDVIKHLQTKREKLDYAKLMYAIDMKPAPGVIPTCWNHLNVCDATTKLLHYTKEPEQPWYKPDHPLAELWRRELQVSLHVGKVSEQELLEAIDRWDVKEDWRSTNGLHPYYRRFIEGVRSMKRRDGKPPESKAAG